MKAKIHPQYFESARVTCSCGNSFTIGSTQELIRVELCNKCHPYFTGDQRFIDSRSIIQDFQNKREKAKDYKAQAALKVEKDKKQQEGPKTLREMLMSVK